MASTQPSGQFNYTNIALAGVGIVATASLAYAVYFDHRRRSDPEFRRQLKRQHKKISKQDELSAKAAERQQKDRVKQVVESANEDGFPRDPEETEGYFMKQVAEGEAKCADGSDPIDAALCFYRALKVYPQPKELINIYDKTVPKVSSIRPMQRPNVCRDDNSLTFSSQPILDILAEMIAVDPSISVTGSSAGSDAGSERVD